ncbi:unnamed protein product [Polarella glacialis]|uniref:Fibronectin type-III domain-containing protein n=1 Tax=Polarella glacialis TaxID=89957 RepID=A0A813LQA1_POLGL|nr:unnamed protein product [Polarella glacialis]
MGVTGLDIVELSALPQAATPIVLQMPAGAVKVLPRWADEDEVSKWRLKYRLGTKDDIDFNSDGEPWLELELRHFTRELPLSGLEFGQPYHFKVAIETPDGWSDWSQAVECVPPEPSLPGKCAAVYSLVKGDSTAEIRWTKPVDFAVTAQCARITRYQIRVTWPGEGEQSEDCQQDIIIDEDTDTWDVPNLLSLTNYTFQVAAENITGWGEWSDFSPAITMQPPVPITLNSPTLRRATHHSAVIQWQHPPESATLVESFRFRYGTSPTKWIPKDFVEIQDVSSNLSQYVIESLKPGSIYYFQVRALNTYGMGIWSDSSIPIRTLDGKEPSKVVELRVPHIYKSFITLQWPPAEENGYPLTGHLLRYAHTPDMEKPVEIQPTVVRKDGCDTCDIRHLRKLKYHFQVAAINKMGMAEWSDMVVVDMTEPPHAIEDSSTRALKNA